jgi:hypothetical protein
MRSLPSRCRPANWSRFIRACIDKPGTLSHEIAKDPNNQAYHRDRRRDENDALRFVYTNCAKATLRDNLETNHL